jgi:hypothetical protein
MITELVLFYLLPMYLIKKIFSKLKNIYIKSKKLS